jgi:hypothetical protein
LYAAIWKANETSSVEYRDNEARESIARETVVLVDELYYRTDSKWTIEERRE